MRVSRFEIRVASQRVEVNGVVRTRWRTGALPTTSVLYASRKDVVEFD
jgi:hypothetical protein